MTLRVTLEVVPFGIEDNKRTIKTINIHNIGQTHSQDPDQCEYSFDVDGNTAPETVIHFRSEGAPELVRKVLETEFFD